MLGDNIDRDYSGLALGHLYPDFFYYEIGLARIKSLFAHMDVLLHKRLWHIESSGSGT